MDYHNHMKNLNKKIRVNKGERVISKLAGTGMDDKWEEIVALHCSAVRKAKELESAYQLLSAKTVVFWNEIKNYTEQAESAEDRGKTLAMRHDADDNLVLVEYTEKPANPKELFRKMFGLEGLEGIGDDGD